MRTTSLALGLLILSSSLLAQEKQIDFNRDVRPILSDNCYACHGPDEGTRESDWRLDQPMPPNSDIVFSGKPEQSELIARILSDDESEVMPPYEHRKKLTDEQKQILVKWVEQGANWDDHWSFRPPVRVDASNVDSSEEIANWVDQFISQKRSEAALTPSPEADRVTLIRRLYFDLIGLPPSYEEVDAFLKDQSDDAYEKRVDQLLASEHFGERMAVYWLDLVRYADSVGYHGDQEISASPFRDYVIDAFNQNMPFDRFTREQLAGDLLQNPTQDQLIASGYNRLGMMSAEGGVQPKEYLAKYAAERVRTTSTVWLGMTLGCAECHDHKFDPFSIEDFYNFAAFFADIKERGLYSGANSTGDWGPTVSVPDDGLADLLKPIDLAINELDKQLYDMSPELIAAQKSWEANINETDTEWQHVKPLQFNSYSKTEYDIRDDHSVIVKGTPNAEDVYLVSLELPASTTAIRIEALPDNSLPRKGPGRAGNGNFVITELMLAQDDLVNEMEALKKVYSLWPDEFVDKRIELTKASASFEQSSHPDQNPYGKWAAESAIDHEKHGPTWGWAINPESGKAHELVVHLETPIAQSAAQTVTLVIQQFHGTNHTLGRFRVSSTASENASIAWEKRIPKKLLDVIRLEREKRSESQNDELLKYYRSVAPDLEPIRKQLEQKQNERKALVKAHTRTSPITVAVEPREMRVLARGNWMDDSGKLVTPKVPMRLNQIDREGRANRLDLANWILQAENPLTARVFVNRLWKLYFGTGLSKVLDDLGSQGELPSHPELLDSLAVEFVESGWDIKHMVKLMVLSKTYRQSSRSNELLEQADAYNRLLARQSRFRLDAEFIRDNALTVSGLLIDEIGGRSAKPYQPAGLYRHLNFPRRTYTADTDKNQYRRGLYTHWQRQFLHPAMKTFDAPSREECTCERARSNTPLGALVLLNDPSYIEAARNFANRLLVETKFDNDKDKIDWLLKQALSRPAQDSEIEILKALVESHRKQYAELPTEANELLAIGNSKPMDGVDPVELAAWTNVARTIMNLHEFIVRN